MSNDTTLTMRVGFEYVDVPDGYVITEQSSDFAKVQFELRGAEVNDVVDAIRGFNTVISMKDVVVDSNDVFVYTYSPSADIKTQVNDELAMTVDYTVITDSVMLTLQKAETKTVKVVDNLTFALSLGYVLMPNSGLSVDSVTITGLKSDVDEIDDIVLQYSLLGKKSAPFEKTFDLEESYPQFKIEPQVVKYMADIEECTEGTVALKLSDYAGHNIMFFPDSINVIYQVPLNKYRNVSASDFETQILFPDGEYNKAAVEVNSKSADIIVFDVTPYVVEYLIFE